MTGISDYMSSIPSNSDRDWSLYYVALPIDSHLSFVDFILLFTFHYETTTKAKFIFYAKENGN